MPVPRVGLLRGAAVGGHIPGNAEYPRRLPAQPAIDAAAHTDVPHLAVRQYRPELAVVPWIWPAGKMERLRETIRGWRPRPVYACVFGSAARGDGGPDSDIDLLVVVDDDTPAEKVTIKAGRESRRPYRLPADVIPVREEIWRRFSRVVGTLPYAARTEGIVVYERG